MASEKKKRKFNRHTLRNPKKTRKGEVIGGGWWVFRRGDGTGRIRVPMWPYEHPDAESAHKQAENLAVQNPGEKFVVVHQHGEAECVEL